MSKRLREKAMNYFDENVMNPYLHLIVPISQLQRIHILAQLLLANQVFPCKSSSASTTYSTDYHLNHNKDSKVLRIKPTSQ
ncbi:hypothetical protein AAC387_Pa02g4741 [Persea americana]